MKNKLLLLLVLINSINYTFAHGMSIEGFIMFDAIFSFGLIGIIIFFTTFFYSWKLRKNKKSLFFLISKILQFIIIFIIGPIISIIILDVFEGSFIEKYGVTSFIFDFIFDFLFIWFPIFWGLCVSIFYYIGVRRRYNLLGISPKEKNLFLNKIYIVLSIGTMGMTYGFASIFCIGLVTLRLPVLYYRMALFESEKIKNNETQ